ncbi:lymphocyte-specific protein 1-like [Myripristis murdjan]|uniref:lymphocyte-specific protein 1-like n=1 Tax=Myripristis murdjan TaxID=586833 RepID=UPI0011763825|nr:lymphocyte-specific protein 1-like [Myripristis murdjan]
MFGSLRRSSSSRLDLQNLTRVTVQRSLEDAEEAERQRRRRDREKLRGAGGPSCTETPEHNMARDEQQKPSCRPVLEEDEGFSDWSHRLENREQLRVQEACRARERRPATPRWKSEPGEKEEEEEEEEQWEPEPISRAQEAPAGRTGEMCSRKQEVKASYSSTVFMMQDSSSQSADRTSYLVAGTIRARSGLKEQKQRRSREENQRRTGEESQGRSREENQGWSLEENQRRTREESQRRSLEEENQRRSREENQWRSTEENQRRSGEDNQRITKEENQRRSKEENQRRTREENQRRSKEENQRRSLEEENQRRSLEEERRRSCVSLSSGEGEEASHGYGPMSPTFKKLLIQFYPEELDSRVDASYKITERAESLRRSLNVTKKSPPPPPPPAVCTLDSRLERYTHAAQISCSEVKAGRAADLPSPAEPVASRRNLFESWSRSPVSLNPAKDTEALKVGVAELVSQWVRGGADGSRDAATTPAGSSSGKRYKFMVTGHGKYEKISVDDDDENTTCHSGSDKWFVDVENVEECVNVSK